jgi:uncharacterized protein
MRLELEKLPPVSFWSHAYELGELDLQQSNARVSGLVTVTGTARQNEREVRVAGRLSALVEADCDRCLEPVPFALALEIGAVYVTLESYQASREADLSEDDLGLMVYQDGVIDIDELARGEILLGLPAQVLCSPDCLGLCPDCGVNRNANTCKCGGSRTDPRWAALKDLKF